jgi:bifunctional DNA-binding transcriptional regulator/antitoxin component of YhaV-PrlF toxin-antitoxin module
MTEKGRVTVPSAVRARRKPGYKSTLVFFESASGDLILRPSKASPELDLVDPPRRFKGLELPERKHLTPPRA